MGQHAHSISTGQARHLLGKLILDSEARISLAQHSMTVAREHLTGLECGPDEVVEVLLGVVFAELLVHLGQPDQHLCTDTTGN